MSTITHLAVDALDVVVAVLLEESHQCGFHSLGLVDDGLGADLDAPNLVESNVVLLCTCERDRGDARLPMRLCTAVSITELMSSFSSQNDMASCPSPTVYLPARSA